MLDRDAVAEPAKGRRDLEVLPAQPGVWSVVMTRTCAPRVPERATSACARARSGAVQRLVSPAVNGQYGLYPGRPGGRIWQVGVARSRPAHVRDHPAAVEGEGERAPRVHVVERRPVRVQEHPVRLRCRRDVELRRVLRPRRREQAPQARRPRARRSVRLLPRGRRCGCRPACPSPARGSCCARSCPGAPRAGPSATRRGTRGCARGARTCAA